MRKGLIGSFRFGPPSSLWDADRAAGDIMKLRGLDVQTIFYGSAFQTGIDEFVIPDMRYATDGFSLFVADRTAYMPKHTSEENIKLVMDAFSQFLPEGWSSRAMHESW